MKKIAVIGCGALSNVFADALEQKLSQHYKIIGFLGKTYDHTKDMAQKYNADAYQTLDELIDAKPDYTVEFAGGDAVREYAKPVLSSGLNLIIASIGALADEKLKNDLEDTASKASSRLFLISGAIGGFDVMQTLSMMGRVTGVISNEKAPDSLVGAPYLDTHPLDPKVEQTVFCGSVEEAIAGFPKNVNVAVAASLAANCPEMKVEIKSIPEKKDNAHIIHLENETVQVDLSICSKPDPVNPKSSTMTAWSVIALLKNLISPVIYF